VDITKKTNNHISAYMKTSTEPQTKKTNPGCILDIRVQKHKKSIRNVNVEIPKRGNSDNISLMIKMCRCALNIQWHETERPITSVIAGSCNIIIIIIIIIFINSNWVVNNISDSR